MFGRCHMSLAQVPSLPASGFWLLFFNWRRKWYCNHSGKPSHSGTHLVVLVLLVLTCIIYCDVNAIPLIPVPDVPGILLRELSLVLLRICLLQCLPDTLLENHVKALQCITTDGLRPYHSISVYQSASGCNSSPLILGALGGNLSPGMSHRTANLPKTCHKTGH